MASDYEEKRDCAKCCVPLNKVKVGVRIYTIITGVLLTVFVGGEWYKDVASAERPVQHAEMKKDVERNKEKIKEIIEAHKNLVDTQENMQEELESLNIKQTRIITILERIERKVDE